jgi:alanine racemase
LSLVTQIVQIRTLRPGETVSYNCTFRASRPTRIGVLPIGYADGYNRLLSNKGTVLIGGKRVPVIGRICMDMTMVDVTDVPEAHVGADAVLIGEQGPERITALDLACWQGTIPYEVLCAIGPRVPRLYLE